MFLCLYLWLLHWFSWVSFMPIQALEVPQSPNNVYAKNKGGFSTLDAQNNSLQSISWNRSCSFHYRYCYLASAGLTVATETDGSPVQQSGVTGKQQSLVCTPAIHWHKHISKTHSRNLSTLQTGTTKNSTTFVTTDWRKVKRPRLNLISPITWLQHETHSH